MCIVLWSDRIELKSNRIESIQKYKKKERAQTRDTKRVVPIDRILRREN